MVESQYETSERSARLSSLTSVRLESLTYDERMRMCIAKAGGRDHNAIDGLLRDE
jgi:hypothetical protein